jgi:lipopolysaccharide export system ATP-binding protein
LTTLAAWFSEASVRKFLSIFGGAARRKAPAAERWNMDLQSLGGPMAAGRGEAVNLPSQKSGQNPKNAKQPTRPPPAGPDGAALRAQANGYPAPPRRRDEPMPPPRQEPRPEPPPAHRPMPTEAREARSPGGRAPQGASQGRAPSARSREEVGARQSGREAYLATFGLEKSFGGRKVVRGPSLYVRRGEAVGLLGPNGAGKTTVFYMITGLIKPDRGRIELDGYDVTRLPMYQRARLGIGYLPQEASIFRGLSVEDNIRAVLEVTEPNRRRREADLDGLLAEFGLTKLRKSPTIALSGGERRRCEIARALATRPNYMLLDEPFAGIDPIAVGDIKALVRHLTNRGIGVLITDHNVRETLALTDRAYIIYSGEVLREGRAMDIVNDPEVRRLYLGEEFRM